MLSTILWANEFDPNNGFSAFGSNAANARLDVETAISAWENVIQNFNQPGGGNSLTVTVSISGKGRGGNTNTTALNAGYPTSAAISLAGGDDGNGAGYFFDPTPSDNSEFEGTLVNDFSGLAQSGSPASNLTDFYTIITHELGHAVGFTGFNSLYQSSSYIHETNVPNPPAFFWVFQGPSVTHLMTSNNGGTSDYGVPIHSAWTDGNVPWQGQQLHGVEDLMNAGSGPSERRLIPSYLALILHDVYNYDVTAPQYMDTMFAMLDSQGNLLLRGGVGSSNDVITISQDPVFASFFVVSISIGSPVAGISPNPVYTQEYYAPAVKAITIEAGAGSNVINLQSAPVPVNIEGSGTDTVNIGSAAPSLGGTLANIAAPVNVSSTSGSTTLNVDDSGDTTAGTAHMGTISGSPGLGYIDGLAHALITYEYAYTASLTINTGTASGNVFGVWENGVPTTLIGNGLTTVNVGDGLVGVQSILGTLNIENPSSFTTINVDDSANTGINTAHMGTIPSGPPSWGYITGLAPADIHYKYADATSLTINTSSADGDVFSVWENGVPTTLIGNGLTTVNVGDGLVGVQSILGTLNIENPSSFTTINVDDSANTGINTAHMGTIPSGPPSWGYITGLAASANINYRYADTTSLTINGSSGDGDVFGVWENGVPTTLNLNAAATVNVGDGNVGLAAIQGPLTVNSALADFVTLNLNDQADATGRTVTMATGSVSGLAPADIDYGPIALANLNVNGGQGNDAFDWNSPLPTIPLSIDGGGGTNALTISDQGNMADAIYTVTANTVSRTGTALITYANLTNLALYGGTGSNVLYVESTAAGTTTDVYGGTGGSIDEFWPYLYSVQGPLNLHGQSGSGGESFAIFYDYLDSTPGSYTLTAGALNGSHMSPITYDHLVDYDLYTSALASAAINVQSNAAGMGIGIFVGPGDQVTLGSQAPGLGGTLANIQGVVTLASSGQGQLPSITLDDSADMTAHPQAVISTYPAPYDYQLSGLAPAQIIFGLDQATPVNILGGMGNDNFTVDSPLSATGITIDGGGGVNSLTYDDRSTATAQTYDIEARTIARADGATIGYANFSNLTLDTGSAGNYIGVGSTAAGTTTDVYGGSGNDEFTMENNSNLLDSILGPVNIHGGGGPYDYVQFVDSGNTVGQTYTLTANTLTRSGIAPITWDTMNQVVLYTGSGQDHVNVQAVAAGTFESLVIGTGDTMTVGSLAPGLGGTLANILGPLRAEPVAGQTPSVVVDDSGDATSHPQASFQTDTYGYNLTGLAPRAPIYFQLAPASSVKVLGGTGNDTFTVANPPPGTGIQIDGGGGTNTLAGPSTANTWAITGQNSGTLDTVAFSNFQNLVGGATSDAFQFSAAKGVTGTINGGTGIATLDYSRYTTRVNVNLGNGTNGTATGVGGTVTGITALIGGNSNDTLSAGTVPNVALTGGLGTNSLSGTGSGDRVVESIATSYTLTNTKLTGTGAGFTDNLSGITVASLTGVNAVGNAFTVSGWTGTGSLTAPASTGTVTARKSAGFTLANTLLSSTDGMTLGLNGITTANLSDAAGGNTFTVTGWAGSGTLKGSTEMLVDGVSSSVILANTSLAVTGLPTLTLSGFTTANLSDTAGGNTFTVGGWKGSGSLTDSAAIMDTVAASKSASFTLTNTSLSSTDLMSLGLSGITTANLAATSSSKTFTVSGWTGSGSLTDTASGIVTATKNAGFTLTNSSLSSTDGMTVSMSGITRANLTATAMSSSPSYIVDASAFTGVTNLTTAGTVNAILFGGSANGSTLSATGSGDDVLIGGPGKDTLTDRGTGYNILIGGPGADKITGNGNDILISGTTSYFSDTSPNIAALDAMLAEWSSSDSYSLRISKITNGVGPGGMDALNSSTCQSDVVANTVSDGGAFSTQNNWFIVNSKDKVTKMSNETETIV